MEKPKTNYVRLLFLPLLCLLVPFPSGAQTRLNEEGKCSAEARLAQPVKLQAEITKLRGSIVANDFSVDRGYEEYKKHFGSQYARDLARLSPGGHWIDMGAGEARAQLGYMSQIQDHARVTAIARERPPLTDDVKKLEAQARHHDRFRYLSGRFFEEIPLSEIGKADLITDSYGVLYYTDRLSQAFNMYLKLLRPGGAIYTYGFDGDHLSDRYGPMRVKTKNGQEVPFYRWLESIPGIKVETASSNWDDKKPTAFRITVTRPDVQIPELVYDSTDFLYSPRKVFRVKPAPAQH